MEFTEFEDGLVALETRLRQGDPIDPEELTRELARYETALQRLEIEAAALRAQEAHENKVLRAIQKLEARTRHIKEEAMELESTELAKDANRLSQLAVELERQLNELGKTLLDARQKNLPNLQQQVKGLEPQVAQLEKDYQDLLDKIEANEGPAKEEDELPGAVRWALMQLRAGIFHLKQGLRECEYLSGRGEHLEHAQRQLQGLPEDEAEFLAQGYPPHYAKHLSEGVVRLRQMLRNQLQDIHHLVSEGIKETDLDGAELSLAYAMGEKWRQGDKEGFYHRLWTLNFLMLHGRDIDPELRKKVRSLLTLVNGTVSSKEKKRREHAAEARRFLMLAGNGVIRRVLEDNFNGLAAQEDYERLGKLLVDKRRPDWLYTLQMAVQLPRVFDLSLNERFKGIFETHYRRNQVPHPTNYPEMRLAEDFDDVGQLAPEDLVPGWERRLMDGELHVVRHEEQTETQVEVGHEQSTEAQVYMLDVSISMGPPARPGNSGQRWRFRNAALIAALNTFSVDAAAKDTEQFENLLYFAEFGSHVRDIRVVRNTREAKKVLIETLNRIGEDLGTDLHEAVLSAYRAIRSARGRHRALREAKVVVVTDGGANLWIDELLREQQIEGTRIVTHVFATEEENEELRHLSRASGPGRAFYHFIEAANDPGLAASPPYGKAEEFSPVWNEPHFETAKDQNRFEADVSRLCRDTVDAFRYARRSRDEHEEMRTYELDALMSETRGMGQDAYEDGGRTSEERNRRLRKTQRTRDILEFLNATVDDDMSRGEVMDLFRALADARALLPREFREVCRTARDSELRTAIHRFDEQVMPKLRAG